MSAAEGMTAARAHMAAGPRKRTGGTNEYKARRRAQGLCERCAQPFGPTSPRLCDACLRHKREHDLAAYRQRLSNAPREPGPTPAKARELVRCGRCLGLEWSDREHECVPPEMPRAASGMFVCGYPTVIR